MCEMYTGISRTMGFSAFFPMTVRRQTSSEASSGFLASCAPRNSMSLNPGTGRRVSIGSPGLLPVYDISRISSIGPLSCLMKRGSIETSSSLDPSSTGSGTAAGAGPSSSHR